MESLQWARSIMQRKLPKHRVIYNRLKKKSPHIPTITCPAIDEVISRLEKISNGTQILTPRTTKALERKLEKLRVANEKLRDSGIYWNKATKDVIEKFVAQKKRRLF